MIGTSSMRSKTLKAIDLTVNQTATDEGTRRLLQLRNVKDVLHREVDIFYDLLDQREMDRRPCSTASSLPSFFMQCNWGRT